MLPWMGRTTTPGAARAQLVLDLVRSELGLSALSAEHMTFGHGSVTYDVDTGGRHLIVRTNDDPDVFAGTDATLAQLRAAGIPVPTALAVDLSCRRYPFAWMVLEKIPGRDLRYELPSMTEVERGDVAHRVASIQRSAHALARSTRFGFAPIGQVPEHATWLDVVHACLTRSDAADTAVRPWTDEVRDALSTFDTYLSSVEPVCFLDDMTTKNVIVEDGKLRGVIDFDVVCYGDALYWLALVDVAVEFDVGAAGRSYVNRLRHHYGVTAHQERVVSLYRAVHGCDFFARSAADDREKARAVDIIAEATTAARR